MNFVSARRLTVATLALTLVTLTGCASATPAAGGAAESSTTDDTRVSGHLSVAAAASLQPAFEDLTADFTKAHPDVTFDNLTFDGSAVLATQIIGGAPVDVFASADERNMSLVSEAHMLASPAVPFATSSLEIAVAPGNPLGIKTLADLARAGSTGKFPTVVVCAAEVPCGSASRKLLDRDGVELHAASEEQSVTAVLTKVASGEADAGLVYRSDVLRSDGDVVGIEIPNAIDAAGTYLIAPIEGSGTEPTAQAFAEYLLSDAAQAHLAELGFGPVTVK